MCSPCVYSNCLLLFVLLPLFFFCHCNTCSATEVNLRLARLFVWPFQLLDDVCGQLLTFYRSREPNLVHFSLQCLPPLIHAYLNAVASRNQKVARRVEAASHAWVCARRGSVAECSAEGMLGA